MNVYYLMNNAKILFRGWNSCLSQFIPDENKFGSLGAAGT